MIYKATIEKIVAIEEYEGLLLINIEDIKLLAIYWAFDDYIKHNIKVSSNIDIDLWLFDVDVKTVLNKKRITNDTRTAGSHLFGKILKKMSDFEIRVDCGELTFDIRSGEKIRFDINDYIETEGSNQIFFPENRMEL